jgi:hypothetical protein
VVVAADGTDRELAAWPVREPYGHVVLARSDDGTRAGVLIGDEGWHVVELRVDAQADEVVVLLLEGFPDPCPLKGEDPTAWAVVALGLGGNGPVRGIAHGTRPGGHGTSFAL